MFKRCNTQWLNQDISLLPSFIKFYVSKVAQLPRVIKTGYAHVVSTESGVQDPSILMFCCSRVFPGPQA